MSHDNYMITEHAKCKVKLFILQKTTQRSLISDDYWFDDIHFSDET